MSLITQKPPCTVTVEGEEYQIETDFRIWIEFSQIMSSSLDITEKTLKALNLVFPTLPPTFDIAQQCIMHMYFGDVSDDGDSKASKKRSFDFEQDADLIYSAFLQEYNIDLTTVNMHWWTFKALFSGLTEKTRFVQIMQIRGMNLRDIKDKNQREYYRKLQNKYRLNDTRSQEEKDADIGATFASAF